MYAEEFGERDAGEVLVAAVADVDGIVQKLKQRVRSAGELKPSDLDALGEWLDRVARMSRAVLDLKLDERRVRVEEQVGLQVADMIRGTLTDLGLDPAAPAVMRVVSTRLLALAGGAA